MANMWIDHVKKVAADKGISYREALKVAGETYHRKSKTHPGELDYTTKKGDVVFHEKGKDVKKSRKPYMEGGEVKPFMAEGEGPVWDAIVELVQKTKKLFTNLDIVQEVIDLVENLLDNEATIADKIAAGKKVFVKFVTNLVLSAVMDKGPLVIWIVKKIVPLMAGVLYDLISRKISGGAKVKSVKPYMRDLKKKLVKLGKK